MARRARVTKKDEPAAPPRRSARINRRQATAAAAAAAATAAAAAAAAASSGAGVSATATATTTPIRSTPATKSNGVRKRSLNTGPPPVLNDCKTRSSIHRLLNPANILDPSEYKGPSKGKAASDTNKENGATASYGTPFPPFLADAPLGSAGPTSEYMVAHRRHHSAYEPGVGVAGPGPRSQAIMMRHSPADSVESSFASQPSGGSMQQSSDTSSSVDTTPILEFARTAAAAPRISYDRAEQEIHQMRRAPARCELDVMWAAQSLFHMRYGPRWCTK